MQEQQQRLAVAGLMVGQSFFLVDNHIKQIWWSVIYILLKP